MQYIFDVEIATKYGIDVAVFLKNIAYWVVYNQANSKNYHDGRYWTYNTLESYSMLFPFWTCRQVERVIKNTIKADLILKGNYNIVQYDRTIWYTLSDKSHKLLNISISPNGEMHFTERWNAFHRTVGPIPDNKPDNKPERESDSLSVDNFCKKTDQEKKEKTFLPNETNISLCKELSLCLESEIESFKNRNKRGMTQYEFTRWIKNSYNYKNNNKIDQKKSHLEEEIPRSAVNRMPFFESSRK